MTPEERAREIAGKCDCAGGVPKPPGSFGRCGNCRAFDFALGHIRSAVEEETERCAKLCDSIAAAKQVRRSGPLRGLDPDSDTDGWEPMPLDVRAGANACADAIRRKP